MKLAQVFVSEIYMNGSAVCLHFDPAFRFSIQPGQYLSARAQGDILPGTLFPGGLDGAYLTSAQDTPVTWQPGVSLSIRYPMGKGFAIPSTVRRLLMISAAGHPQRLLPVAGIILANGGEAALFSYSQPNEISPEIELLTRDQLQDACAWADCIIGDTSFDHLRVWKSMVIRGDSAGSKRNIQVLVDTPLACHGTAECGVCAVKTKRGWINACSDGPVFQLAELDI